ncbi:MAG: radical SAM protein [Rhodomicrobium sp.]
MNERSGNIEGKAPLDNSAAAEARMSLDPIRYVPPVYRPPSEAESLILPLTDGCSWNRCTFCEMYKDPQKRFRPRSEAEVLESIRRCGEEFGAEVRRVFLADGDALTLSTRRLVTVLEAIRRDLPGVRRVSSYCLPRNLSHKSVEELKELAALGLSLVYVGAESGDDEVLARVQKGETFATTLDALEKLGQAGIKRSAMILNGLGGRALSAQHAANSAALMNAAQPEFLATLVVTFPKGEERLRAEFPGWAPLGIVDLMREMEAFVSALELKRTVFRSDHASNWLVLKGTLGADKPRLLQQLRAAIAVPEEAPLRPAWARGL